MGIDVIDVASRSLHALIDNRTILIYAIVGGVVSALLSAVFLSQATAISSISGQPFAMVLPVLVSFLGVSAVGMLLAFLIGVFITGSIISAANSGGRLGAGDAAKHAVDRYVTLLVTVIAEGILIGIGLILLVIPGIFLAVKLSLAPVEAVAGKKGVVDPLKGSWNATEGNFWA